ncbi:hypothetical protein D3C78_1497470 [compost metagenome]
MIDGLEAQALERCNGGLIIVIKLDLIRTASCALVIDFMFDRLQCVTDLVFESQWLG